MTDNPLEGLPLRYLIGASDDDLREQGITLRTVGTIVMTKIIDTNNITTGKLSLLKADGIETIIRYISTSNPGGKRVEIPEARAIAAASLKLALVFEVWGGTDNFVHGDINGSNGKLHGAFARDWAAHVGAPDGTIIYFAIDTDCTANQFNGLVKPYLIAAKAALAGKFRIGVYACGYVCQQVIDQGLVDATWLTESMGFNGSRAFRQSGRATLDQLHEYTLHGLSVDDNVANVADYGQFVPFAASSVPASGATAADAPPAAPPTPAPAPAVQAPPASVSKPAWWDAVLAAASASKAIHHAWTGRGQAPAGYIKGMALAMGYLHQGLLASNDASLFMAMPNSGNDAADALSWYDRAFGSLGMDNSIAGPDTLRHLITLMVGLGMRESSGKFCEGRDTSADNVQSDTAEAGMFQMSWDIRGASRRIPDLFEHYHAAGDDPEGLGPIFHEGVSCSTANLADFGSGDGKEFQRLAKASPMFSVAICGIGLRTARRHWGPINRHEAEIVLEVDALFRQVQGLVDAVPIA